ncbi:MAG: amylo-alpha-1,6-glucosidase [Verrucomicrobiota bacterium]
MDNPILKNGSPAATVAPQKSPSHTKGISLESESTEGTRTYRMTTDCDLRDDLPQDKQVTITETPMQARCRSGNLLFDGLFALAIQEAHQNSVSFIQDADYADGESIEINAYKTGEKWNFVWTRDLAYALDLGLASHDTGRALDSLRFKASRLKSGIQEGFQQQIVQDTGSGGSYPVSTDRVVWALGAYETSLHLSSYERQEFIKEIFPILRDTIEQDRVLVFDSASGLYRGEQSFLDWREQTYPQWTEHDTLAIAMSKALSVNAINVFLLRMAADCGRQLNHAVEAERYESWADQLQSVINEKFYDEDAGLYRTYLLSEFGEYDLALPRFDLLGQCLAILFNIANEERTQRILANYPTGLHGPAVVWPQEKGVAIYHNQGIWPFVTAYWIKAGVKAGHSSVVDAGVKSLMDLAAANLSNMENFDFVSGRAYIKLAEQEGPVINSRRQLWSVAGYLYSVQNAIFGLNAETEGIRIAPFVTQWMRRELFAGSERVVLFNAPCLNTLHTITLHLPEATAAISGTAAVRRIVLNGSQVTGETVAASLLQDENHWEVYLEASDSTREDRSLTNVDVQCPEAIYSPAQPEWDASDGGVRCTSGLLTLSFNHPCPDGLVFDIYRNGKLYTTVHNTDDWQDPYSADYEKRGYVYNVVARSLKQGFVSHPTRGRRYIAPNQQIILNTTEMVLNGAEFVERYIEGWGLPAHEIRVPNIRVCYSGRYAIQVSYANGAGPINTGIACAVKRLEIGSNSSECIEMGYLIMPQTGSWTQYQLSNSVVVQLDHTKDYTLCIFEDSYSRNMSFLASNENYTALPGGGAECHNLVNISNIRFSFLG